MCETCALPETGRPRIPRTAKIQWAVLGLVAAVVVLVGAFGSADHPPGDRPRRVAAPERVFLGDMARQLAGARRLVAQTTASPRLAALARRIEQRDREVIARAGIAPPSVPPAGQIRQPGALRQAIRRHSREDRIIAQVELATGSNATAKHAAARLLRASRTWLDAVR